MTAIGFYHLQRMALEQALPKLLEKALERELKVVVLAGSEERVLLEAAGKAEDELLWRLPLAEVYDKDINSDIADMQNIGADRAGGSITAAQFLQRFIEDVPWAHLDIAGTAWSKKAKPTVPKGATAFGVRLLDRLVADHYEV